MGVGGECHVDGDTATLSLRLTDVIRSAFAGVREPRGAAVCPLDVPV